MPSPLLPLVVAATAAATPAMPSTPTYRFEIDAGLVGRFVVVDSNLRKPPLLDPMAATQPFTGDMQSLVGRATLRAYLRPVVDDDAPPPLQAYLQRASHMSLSLDGGGQKIDSSWADEPSRRGGGMRLAFDGYVTRWLAVWMHAGFDYVEYGSFTLADLGGFAPRSAILQLSPTWYAPVAGGVAVRVRDVRVGVGYEYPLAWSTSSTPGSSATFYDAGWGTFLIDGRIVLRRSIDVVARARVYDFGRGVGGDGTLVATWYVKRRTGLTFGAGGGRGIEATSAWWKLPLDCFAACNSLRASNAAFALLGATHWFRDDLGLTARYEFRADWNPNWLGSRSTAWVADYTNELRVDVTARF